MMNIGNKKYGPQTWDLLELKAKQPCKWGTLEMEALIEHYKREVEKIKKEKGI